MNSIALRELIGTVGAIFIFSSMCFNTETRKGEILLRFFNLVGSIIYVIYGYLLNAYSSVIMNLILTFINGYYLLRSIKKLISSMKK